MPVFARRFLFTLLMFCFLSWLSLPASADSVTVSGTGYAGGDSSGMSLTAGIATIFSASPIGQSQLGSGTAGVPMTVSFWVEPWSGLGYTDVRVGSQFTDILQGAGILFTGTFTVPFSAIAKGTFTAPVTLTGQLLAYQDLGQGLKGPLIASLTFSGTGKATFQLLDVGNGQFIISYADLTYKGTGNLTVVPEPASLFLMGTGLAALGAMMRRKGLFRS